MILLLLPLLLLLLLHPLFALVLDLDLQFLILGRLIVFHCQRLLTSFSICRPVSLGQSEKKKNLVECSPIYYSDSLFLFSFEN